MSQQSNETQNDFSKSSSETENKNNSLLSSFHKFFNVSSFFGNPKDKQTLFEPDEKQQALDNRKAELTVQAGAFLDAHALVPFAKMVAKGYQPDLEQQALFSQNFNALIKNKDFAKLASLVETGMPLKPEHYVALMLSPQIQLFCLPFENLDYVIAEVKRVPNETRSYCCAIGVVLKNYSHDESYNRHLYDYMHHHIALLSAFFEPGKESTQNRHVFNINQQDIDAFFALSQIIAVKGDINAMFDCMVKPLSITEYSEWIAQLDKVKDYQMNTTQGFAYENAVRLERAVESWSSLVEALYNNLNTHFEARFANTIETILDETATVYMDDYLTLKASEESIKNSQHYSIDMLSGNTRDLVQTIRNQYDTLNQNFIKLNEEDQFNLKTLVKDKLPKYINDFLSMKEEYRTTMVNAQGKNAQSLLDESLINISSHLQQIEVRLNENNLKELSVGAKYTQAKNRF
jgi:hypothetical protein